MVGHPSELVTIQYNEGCAAYRIRGAEQLLIIWEIKEYRGRI